MDNVFKAAAGKKFGVTFAQLRVDSSFSRRATFRGPIGGTPGTMQIIETDWGTDADRLGGGLTLFGTVPSEAAPGLYALHRFEQKRNADGSVQAKDDADLINGPQLEVVDAELPSDWPPVRF